MSRGPFHGIVPVLLVTVIGIGNGYWVFRPEILKQREVAAEQKRQELEAIQCATTEISNPASTPAAATSRASPSGDALKPIESISTNSWWSRMLWKSSPAKSSLPEVASVEKKVEGTDERPR